MESISARALETTLKYGLKSFSKDQFKLQGRTVQLSNLVGFSVLWNSFEHKPDEWQIALSQNWLVAAGEESREKVDQKLREMKMLEAVYPRPSAIPPRYLLGIDW
ncbi:hypothetical protein K1719_038146 [Acacia pycnantha]|nr:hypothetical protein K1719_038146 [Acacia pycnantha]